METLRASRINSATAKLAWFKVPASENPFDGVLPEERVEMVVAQGRSRLRGEILVQIGMVGPETLGPRYVGVYRPELTDQGYRRGRDIFVDPSDLRKGIIHTSPDIYGLWIKAQNLGIIIEAPGSSII